MGMALGLLLMMPARRNKAKLDLKKEQKRGKERHDRGRAPTLIQSKY
jgi:hypothetical protein